MNDMNTFITDDSGIIKFYGTIFVIIIIVIVIIIIKKKKK